jgi:hypothetical protein
VPTREEEAFRMASSRRLHDLGELPAAREADTDAPMAEWATYCYTSKAIAQETDPGYVRAGSQCGTLARKLVISPPVMNTAREKRFFTTVRFGSCHRYTETDGTHSRRIISLRDCPILSNSLKGKDQPARGDEIELSIYEADPNEKVIGSIQMFSFIGMGLPPVAFAEFWTASAAADGAARDITIQFENAESSLFTITKVQLVEHMPEAIDYNPKAHGPGYIPGRVHPVVAELRDIRRALAGSWQSIITWLFVVATFVFVTGLIGAGVRALWKSINP